MTHKVLFFTLSALLLTALAGPLLSVNSHLPTEPGALSAAPAGALRVGAANALPAAAASTLQAQEPVQEGQEPGAEEEEDTPLQEHMSIINKSLRKLRRGLRKAEDLPKALPTITAMQAAAQFCKTEIPPMADAMQGEERAQFITGYRLKLIELQGLMLELETAVLKNDLEQAQVVYKKIKAAEDEGHEVYTEDED